MNKLWFLGGIAAALAVVVTGVGLASAANSGKIAQAGKQGTALENCGCQKGAACQGKCGGKENCQCGKKQGSAKPAGCGCGAGTCGQK